MIRVAKEADLQQMLDIYSYYVQQTTYSFEYTLPTLAEFTQRFRKITQRFPWLVWEEEGRVMGYAYGSAPFEREAYQWCSELSVYVDRPFQGRGIGRKLYTAAEQILKLQGFRRIYAIITGENEVSKKFHQALGYETVAVFPHCGVKFGKSLATVWMEKVISSVEIPTNPPILWQAIVNSNRNWQEVLAILSLS